MNILALVGSERPGSVNGWLADAALRHLPADITGTRWTTLADLPIFRQEIEHDPTLESVARLRDAVRAADALVVVTPQHNGSLPSLLKNAIDWLSRPHGEAALAGRPVLVIGATPSPSATAWARADAVRILKVAGAAPLESTVGLGHAFATVEAGHLPADLDAELAAAVGQLVDAARLSALVSA